MKFKPISEKTSKVSRHGSGLALPASGNVAYNFLGHRGRGAGLTRKSESFDNPKSTNMKNK
jgi:hypothetical protein